MAGTTDKLRVKLIEFFADGTRVDKANLSAIMTTILSCESVCPPTLLLSRVHRAALGEDLGDGLGVSISAVKGLGV